MDWLREAVAEYVSGSKGIGSGNGKAPGITKTSHHSHRLSRFWNPTAEDGANLLGKDRRVARVILTSRDFCLAK